MNLSERLFGDLDIPKSTWNLAICGEHHLAMSARMLKSFEASTKDVIPDVVFAVGDAYSKRAGALAAAKLNLPVVHVEA